MTGWTLENQHGVSHAARGHRRQRLTYGETTQGVQRTVPRASRRLEDQRKSFDFQIHVKWGKEARSLLTTSPGQQLPTSLYIR